MNIPVLVRHQSGHAFSRVPLANGRRPQTIASSAWRAICRLMKGYAEGIAEARRMSRAYDELTAMSNSELQDMGIRRTDIPSVVTGTYRNIPYLICGSTSRSQRETPSLERQDSTA